MPTRALLAVFVCGLVLATAACGGEENPFRIGVLTDCRGPFSGLGESFLAGAELPLIERGARLEGRGPGEGVTATRVAGRDVRLHIGCSEVGVHPILVAETRRLVEREHVDAVVGGLGGSDGLVLREVARLYPDVAFVLAGNWQREITIREAAPNVYRFTADDAQRVAGLGTYAYRTLGWRRAAIVADDLAAGWAQADAFTAEFCALGGRVVARHDIFTFDESSYDVRGVPVDDVDGVAILLSVWTGSGPVVKALAQEIGDGRRMVLGSWFTIDSDFLAAGGPVLHGAVASSPASPPGTTAVLRSYDQAFRVAFPGLPVQASTGSATREYHDAVEALLRALEQVDGDLSNGRSTFRAALAELELHTPDGHVALDARHQAVVTAKLVRVVPGRGPNVSALRVFREIPGVDQTFGGLLRRTPTSAASARCARTQPPPWAR